MTDVDWTPPMLVVCQWCGGSVDVLRDIEVPDLIQVMRQVELFRKTCYLCYEGVTIKWSWCCRVWG